MGIEPTSTAWEAVILPMNYIRRLGTIAIIAPDPIKFNRTFYRSIIPASAQICFASSVQIDD